MFRSDGGVGTPSGTEKQRPIAWPAPWYGSWPRITTRTSSKGVSASALKTQVGGRVEAPPGRDLRDEERTKLVHVRRLELVTEHREPALVHARLHAGSLRRQRADLRDDVTAPRRVSRRVVEELRRLDADRREAALHLRGDRRERLVEVGRRVRVREATAGSADELEVLDVAPCLRERRPKALDVVVRRPAERVPAVPVPDESRQEPIVQRRRAEPQADPARSGTASARPRRPRTSRSAPRRTPVTAPRPRARRPGARRAARRAVRTGRRAPRTPAGASSRSAGRRAAPPRGDRGSRGPSRGAAGGGAAR